ncbi:MAG: beta-galactosidase [Bifidobacterium sp.]
MGTYVTERDAIRAFDACIDHHEPHGHLRGADYFRWGMDVISWDDYPFPHTTPSDNAFKHDLMRGVGDGRPFMLMESTPNQTNWQECNVLRAPGRMRAESYQAVAHGADTVQYFQLKQSRGGFEKYHGAVISHGGREDERVYGEVRAIGGELAAHGARFVGGLTEAPVALMFDWDSYWSTENISLLPKGFDYPDQVQRWYAPFHRNIAVDVVPEDDRAAGGLSRAGRAGAHDMFV